MKLFIDQSYSGQVPDLGLPAVRRASFNPAAPDLSEIKRLVSPGLSVLDAEAFDPDVPSTWTPDKLVPLVTSLRSLKSFGVTRALYTLPAGSKWSPMWSIDYGPNLQLLDAMNRAGVFRECEAVAFDAYVYTTPTEPLTQDWYHRLFGFCRQAERVGLPALLYLSPRLLHTPGVPLMPSELWAQLCRTAAALIGTGVVRAVVLFDGWDDARGAIPWPADPAAATAILAAYSAAKWTIDTETVK